MIEKVLYDYLNSALTVPAYMERPAENCPDSFILVEKTGGSRANQIQRSTIAVQSYAPTLYQAATLNETVKQAMLDAVELSDIGAVRLNSDYNFSNTARKEHRYQAVFEITHY